VERFTLKNGVRVVLDPSPDHAAAVVIASRCGSRFEAPEHAGFSHMAEHFLLKATTRRFPTEHALVQTLDRMHAQANASTSPDLVMVWGTVKPRTLAALFSILAECFLHPRINEGLLDGEKGVEDAERTERHHDPDFRAFSLFLKNCYFGSPLAWHALGSANAVARCTAKDLRRFWYRITRPGNLVVAVSGSFDTARMRSAIARRFQHLRPSSSPEPNPFRITQRGRRIEVSRAGSPYSPVGLAIGFPVSGFESPDRLPLAVLANVLGGKDSARLPTELRDAGLAYYAKASSWHWNDVGYFLITTQCSRGKVVEATRRILAQLRSLREDGPTPVEFADAVRYLKDGAREQRHDCLHRAKLYAAQVANFGHPVSAAEYIRQLALLRRRHTLRYARRTFTNRRLNAALHGRLTRAQLAAWKSLLKL
jgi:zinc protease